MATNTTTQRSTSTSTKGKAKAKAKGKARPKGTATTTPRKLVAKHNHAAAIGYASALRTAKARLSTYGGQRTVADDARASLVSANETLANRYLAVGVAIGNVDKARGKRLAEDAYKALNIAKATYYSFLTVARAIDAAGDPPADAMKTTASLKRWAKDNAPAGKTGGGGAESGGGTKRPANPDTVNKRAEELAELIGRLPKDDTAKVRKAIGHLFATVAPHVPLPGIVDVAAIAIGYADTATIARNRMPIKAMAETAIDRLAKATAKAA